MGLKGGRRGVDWKCFFFGRGKNWIFSGRGEWAFK